MPDPRTKFEVVARSDSARSRSRWVRPSLAVLAIAAVLLVSFWAWDREAMIAWRREAGPLPFFAVMSILPALGVPITPLFILAGASFGRWPGLVGSVVALGLNLTLCYAIARRMRPRLTSLLRRFGYHLPDFGAGKKGAVRFTLAVKFAPSVPAFVKNYGLGVAGVPFAPYFVLSMLITGAYATALVVLGESLLEHRSLPVLLATAGVALLALAVWWRVRRNSETPG